MTSPPGDIWSALRRSRTYERGGARGSAAARSACSPALGLEPRPGGDSRKGNCASRARGRRPAAIALRPLLVAHRRSRAQRCSGSARCRARSGETERAMATRRRLHGNPASLEGRDARYDYASLAGTETETRRRKRASARRAALSGERGAEVVYAIARNRASRGHDAGRSQHSRLARLRRARASEGTLGIGWSTTSADSPRADVLRGGRRDQPRAAKRSATAGSALDVRRSGRRSRSTAPFSRRHVELLRRLGRTASASSAPARASSRRRKTEIAPPALAVATRSLFAPAARSRGLPRWRGRSARAERESRTGRPETSARIDPTVEDTRDALASPPREQAQAENSPSRVCPSCRATRRQRPDPLLGSP